MARVAKDSIYHGLSGKVGDVVFKTRNGETFVSKAPGSRRGVDSTAQQRAKEKFTFCSQYAKEVIKEEGLRELYGLAAKETGRTAYNIAFADASHAPVVRSIDAAGYKGKKRNVIEIEAEDDFGVAGLLVSIYSSKGELLEEGYADPDDDMIRWKYEVTKSNSSVRGTKVTATASDLPGNTGLLTITL